MYTVHACDTHLAFTDVYVGLLGPSMTQLFQLLQGLLCTYVFIHTHIVGTYMYKSVNSYNITQVCKFWIIDMENVPIKVCFLFLWYIYIYILYIWCISFFTFAAPYWFTLFSLFFLLLLCTNHGMHPKLTQTGQASDHHIHSPISAQQYIHVVH